MLFKEPACFLFTDMLWTAGLWTLNVISHRRNTTEACRLSEIQRYTRNQQTSPCSRAFFFNWDAKAIKTASWTTRLTVVTLAGFLSND